jgi:signal transduction histidine kinase
MTSFAVLGGATDFSTVATGSVLGVAPVAFGYTLWLQAERGKDRAHLERARAEVVRSQERTQTARDVHDVVGHHLSAIRLQAVGGRRGLAAAHPDADRVLATIAELSHQALGDIRHLLDHLRTDTVATDPPGLADLPALADRLGGNGLRVDVTIDPRLTGAVAPGAETCVHRIVQEALTNVARHSGADRAAVQVEQADGRLVVTVADAGPARSVRPGRNGGLHGMRERVAMLGGTLAGAGRSAGSPPSTPSTSHSTDNSPPAVSRSTTTQLQR